MAPPMRHSCLLLLFLGLAGSPALAQTDFTGQWAAIYHEDTIERIPGPELGDYTGLPNLLPGYLRRNGVPSSGRAVVREYFALSTERNGDTWFVVTTIVEDPEYLTTPFVTSTNFRKQADAGGWKPTPCATR